MSDILITVEQGEEQKQWLAPTDMGLSLMEFLKASEYDVLATCGGMALCATCRVEVLEGDTSTSPISDDEYAILDSLPKVSDKTRLSCQLRLCQEMQGLKVRRELED